LEIKYLSVEKKGGESKCERKKGGLNKVRVDDRPRLRFTEERGEVTIGKKKKMLKTNSKRDHPLRFNKVPSSPISNPRRRKKKTKKKKKKKKKKKTPGKRRPTKRETEYGTGHMAGFFFSQ